MAIRWRPPPFRDIRNTRPSSAEEKARLALRLGHLIRHVPACVNAGSVQDVHDWLDAQAAAMKVAKARRASANDLQLAIKRMESFLGGAE